MRIVTDISLKFHSTMRLGGTADFAVTVKRAEELAKAEAWAESRQLPIIVIGGGSNTIWRDEGFHGLLIINRITGFTKISETETTATYKIGAGENWDHVVERLVAKGLSGVEALSLIPGTAGAGPIQNIGAYGQEIAYSLESVEAFDTMQKAFVELSNTECGFGYRTSRFNTVDKGRFLISSITLTLEKAATLNPPFYRDVEAYFTKHSISTFTPETVRRAVVAIRRAKLPDPETTANCGSFFGNPIVTKQHYKKIAKVYPAIATPPPGWTQPPRWILPDGNVKISAGWLIGEAGFKNYKDRETGMRLWPKQNLVIVNDKAHSTHQLQAFVDTIVQAIQDKYGITLEREPELLP